MAGGLITLTTDFGTADHFVGTMKGVILGIAPAARIVDITHEIAPYDVGEAAFTIAQAWTYFPKKTIHVVIVDPGVGTARRPILCEAGGQYFIAPDNGVLSMIYAATPHKIRMIDNPTVMRREISRTFHGRDVFAPAAAHLSRGITPTQFGKRIHDFVARIGGPPSELARHVWSGTILNVDRFGNLITNFHIDHFAGIKTRPFELRIGLQKIHRLAMTYADTAIGELSAIVGSSGYLEIAANQASAAQTVGCGAGSPLELEIFYDT
jgi:S-adenosylmethionine hydrolase